MIIKRTDGAYQGLLDRNSIAEAAQKHLTPQFDVLTEVIDYGTRRRT